MFNNYFKYYLLCGLFLATSLFSSLNTNIFSYKYIKNDVVITYFHDDSLIGLFKKVFAIATATPQLYIERNAVNGVVNLYGEDFRALLVYIINQTIYKKLNSNRVGSLKIDNITNIDWINKELKAQQSRIQTLVNMFLESDFINDQIKKLKLADKNDQDVLAKQLDMELNFIDILIYSLALDINNSKKENIFNEILEDQEKIHGKYNDEFKSFISGVLGISRKELLIPLAGSLSILKNK